MAARGDSFSAVKKARTYISAALEFAIDEQIIARNPARNVELPSKRLRNPNGRFYTVEEIRKLLSGAAAVSLRDHLIFGCLSSAASVRRNCSSSGWTT